MVKTSFTVTGIDFAKLQENLNVMSDFQVATRDAIAKTATHECTKDNVEVSLSAGTAGSVKVEATITPPAGISALSVQSSLVAAGSQLGSNVQNVFLAMAGPWIIYLCTTGVSDVGMAPPTSGQSVTEGVHWMVGTLALVVVLALLPPTFAFTTISGYILITVYVIYLSWTVYEFEFM